MKRKNQSPMRGQVIRGVQKMILDSGLTYAEIAGRAGLCASAISQFMKKKPEVPSLCTFAMLCKVLDANADEVLGLGEGEKDEA